MLPGQMLSWQLACIKDGPRKLFLKFGQNRVRNSCDIIVVVVIVVVNVVLFCQTLGLVLRLRVDFVLPLSQEEEEQEQEQEEQEPPTKIYQEGVY